MIKIIIDVRRLLKIVHILFNMSFKELIPYKTHINDKKISTCSRLMRKPDLNTTSAAGVSESESLGTRWAYVLLTTFFMIANNIETLLSMNRV